MSSVNLLPFQQVRQLGDVDGDASSAASPPPNHPNNLHFEWQFAECMVLAVARLGASGMEIFATAPGRRTLSSESACSGVG